MTSSKRIAGLVGPAVAAIVAAEFPLVQPELYERQIPPVVYLSGVLLFVAGLAIVRAHNTWRRDWTVLVTLIGWLALLLGLIRMFAASTYQRSAEATGSHVFMVLEGVLFAVGVFLTFQAYRPGDAPD
jgi:FtsH-binding integral membrane protein